MFLPGLVAVLVAAFFIVSFLVIFVLAILEKRHLGDLEAVSPHDVPDLPPYVLAMSHQAAEAKFASQGIHVSRRRRLFTWHWLSPCSTIMAVVATWKAGWITTKVTFLASRLKHKAWIVTTDDTALFEWELSDAGKVLLVLRAGFAELLDAHKEQLGEAAEPLSETTKELERLERAGLERLEERGCARFLDPAQTVWRYTVHGAIQVYFHGWYKMFRKSLTQAERADMSRPGD